MRSQHLCGRVVLLAVVYHLDSALTNETEDKAQPVKKAFPNIRIVLGDLDNSKVLEEEAAKADVVIRTTSLLVTPHTSTRLTIMNRHRRCIGP
jgi:shikimate 5-dehydrogenase